MDAGRWEARWFVAGPLPDDLRPRRSAHHRRDHYDLASLSPVASTKRRGRRAEAEHKRRVGRVELVEVGSLVGFAERWQKQRMRHTPPGWWTAVDKAVWTVDGVELTEVTVGGGAWWTVAVAAGRPAALRVPERWAERLAVATPASYPAWLLELTAARAAFAHRDAG